MSRRSSRLSMGGSALRDSSSRHNARSVSVPRRMSFGGKSLSSSSDFGEDGAEPKKDRRTMLEEWRKQVRARDSASNSNSSTFEDGENKRPRTEYDTSPAKCDPLPTPPLPPQSSGGSSSINSNNMEGTTAIERYRLRRQQKQMQAAADENTAPNSSLMPPQPPSSSSKRTTICFDDDDDSSYARGGLISRTGNTPSFSRRLTISSGAKRRSTRGRRSLAPANFSEFASGEKEISENSTATDGGTEVDTVEGPGLQSRITLMEKRIQELEKEKMALSMSKAPLEARLRQKEDQWLKEKTKYEQEILSLKTNSKEIVEKHKNLEMQLEALQEESSQLRFEARKQKAANTLEQETDGLGDVWSRQLQNDRDVADYKDKLRHAEEEIKSLRLEKVSIESEVNATQLELSALVRDFDDLQADYEELQAKKDSNSEAEIQLLELSKEHTATTAQLNATSGELASLKSQSKFDMEMKEQVWEEERKKLLFDMSVLKSRAGTGTDDENVVIGSDVEDEAVLRARIEERNRRIAELEAQVLHGEQIRRTMHNRIQELRGNIRVFVRMRPFLPGDGGDSNSCIDILPDGESLSIMEHKSKENFDFKFDKVFPPSSGQDSVFDEVSEFVQSALDGYHVCLFSYGQTGSGKTHTMQGSGNGAMRGIIPRAVEQILTQAKVMHEQKWKFSMTASFLEIYNEGLRDLLISMKGENSSKTRTTRNSSKLAIRRDASGKSFVEGLTQIAIDTEDSQAGMQGLRAVIGAAARARSVATTKMNAQSSRSHSVFMLHLNGSNEDSGAVVSGALNLCDLAGSERLDRSGAGSDSKRLKETQAINKSLSCLGDVFNALANGASHIPFRNSKLTYLLQDCLSGDGKALMFVNLSPTAESSNESLCSMRFAQRVNKVELGKATKNIKFTGKGGVKH